jgi:NCAIR mutase (PurE)-related protein
MSDSLEDLLERVAGGRQPVADALAELERLGIGTVGDFARLDLGRGRRKGVPEVVFGQGKTADELAAIVGAFLKHSSSVICSRVSAEQAQAVRDARLGAVDYDDRSAVLVARRPDHVPAERSS